MTRHLSAWIALFVVPVALIVALIALLRVALPSAAAAPEWITTVFQQGLDGYNGTRDATLSAETPADPDGWRQTLTLEWQAYGADTRRALLFFDLSSLPVTATVGSARLELAVADISAAHPVTVSAAPLLRPWAENEATWQQALIGLPWQEPGAGAHGADHDGIAAFGRAAPQSNLVILDLLPVVQQWAADPDSNRGLLLQLQGEAGAFARLNLASREHTDTTLRPRLIVVYTTDQTEATLTPTATETPTDTPTPTATDTPSPTPNPWVTTTLIQGAEAFAGFYDATITSGTPNTNYGSKPDFRASWISYWPGPDDRALLRIELWQIPSGDTIDEAYLSLFVLDRSQATPAQLRVWGLLRHWSEATVTWTRPHTETIGNWATPGAKGVGIDREAAVAAETPINQKTGWVHIPLTNLVRHWIASPEQNFGLVMEVEGLDWETIHYTFASADNPSPELRPRLTIRHSAPGSWRVKLVQEGRYGDGSTDDASISYWQPQTPLGGDNSLVLQWRNAPNDRSDTQRALLRFDLDDLPTMTRVREAQLFFYVPPVVEAELVQLRGWRLLRPWNESEATWLSPVSGAWWGLPGADRIGMDRASEPNLTTTFVQSDGWVGVDVTDLVQFQVAHPEENYGALLAIASLSANDAAYSIFSAQNGQTNLRPLLRLVYSTDRDIPTPTPTPGTTPSPWQEVILRKGLYSFEDVQDTTLIRWQPTTNRGASSLLTVGWRDDLTDPAEDQRALLRFGLDSIPWSAPVREARLSLFFQYSSNPHPVNFKVFRLTRRWWEQQATWQEAGVGQPWARPGADGLESDRLTDPTVSQIIYQPNGWVTLDVTALAQFWLDNPGQNYGMLLMIEGLDGQTVYYDIRSGTHWQADTRPTLFVAYTTDPAVPTPTSTPTYTPTPTPLASPTPGYWHALMLQQGNDGYSGAQDAHIEVYAPEANYGHEPQLDVRWSNDIWPPTADMRSLLYFDLAAVPVGAVVQQATLEVYQTSRSNVTAMNLDLHRVLRAWTETDVSWRRRMQEASGPLLWNVAGASGNNSDREREPHARVVIDSYSGWRSFDVTDLVQLWVNEPGANRGLLLQGKTSNEDTVLVSFASSEYGRDHALRPRLNLVYTTFAGVATATATATHTSTPLPTATPTATPTPTPITASNALVLTLQQGTRGYFGVNDFWMSAGSPSTTHALEQILHVGPSSQAMVARAVLSFNQGQLPPNAEVLGAWLELYLQDLSNGVSLDVSVHMMRRGWAAAAATWQQANTGQPWYRQGANSNLDHDPTPLDMQRLPAEPGWMRWDVTAAVRQWLQEPTENYGFLVKGDGPASVQVGFNSSERVWPGGAPTAGRPRLVIVYRKP